MLTDITRKRRFLRIRNPIRTFAICRIIRYAKVLVSFALNCVSEVNSVRRTEDTINAHVRQPFQRALFYYSEIVMKYFSK